MTVNRHHSQAKHRTQHVCNEAMHSGVLTEHIKGEEKKHCPVSPVPTLWSSADRRTSSAGGGPGRP